MHLLNRHHTLSPVWFLKFDLKCDSALSKDTTCFSGVVPQLLPRSDRQPTRRHDPLKRVLPDLKILRYVFYLPATSW